MCADEPYADLTETEQRLGHIIDNADLDAFKQYFDHEMGWCDFTWVIEWLACRGWIEALDWTIRKRGADFSGDPEVLATPEVKEGGFKPQVQKAQRDAA